MWAEFWIILLAVALVIAAWCIYLIERQRRKERRERLAWKRKYYLTLMLNDSERS